MRKFIKIKVEEIMNSAILDNTEEKLSSKEILVAFHKTKSPKMNKIKFW